MDIKPKIILLVGPPGSGKTTKAKKYTDFTYISQDVMGKKHIVEFHKAITNKENLIIDRMNYNVEQRERYLQYARANDYDTEIQILHIPLSTCLERCNKRANHPTIKNQETAIKATNHFFSRYERVTDSEADVVKRLGWVRKDHAQAIIVDLDGTLANMKHRLKYIQNEKGKDWAKFFNNISKDEIYSWCAELVHMMTEKYPVIYATGRPVKYEKATQEWLAIHELQISGYNLLMRPENDFRPDYIVKEIMLDFEIKTRYNILLAVDDRTQVVEMWRKHNIPTLQYSDRNN